MGPIAVVLPCCFLTAEEDHRMIYGSAILSKPPLKTPGSEPLDVLKWVRVGIMGVWVRRDKPAWRRR
jgi:hypothetical protein